MIVTNCGMQTLILSAHASKLQYQHKKIKGYVSDLQILFKYSIIVSKLWHFTKKQTLQPCIPSDMAAILNKL